MTPWQAGLERYLRGLLDAVHVSLASETLAVLALDVHPWHGHIGVCALTQAELEADPDLLSELAAWKYFDLADMFEDAARKELGDEMSRAYYASDDRAAVADEYLRIAAHALASPTVHAALREFSRSPSFKLSVQHPDSDTEFVAP